MPDPTTEPTTTRLPGLGTRLDLTDVDARAVQVIRRKDGVVDIHTEGSPTIELDAAAARAAGAFMSGHFLLPLDLAERVSDVLGGLVFDWVRLPRGATAIGHSIEELEIRVRTGVTIVAILRGSLPLITPDPQTVLMAGDDLVVAGRAGDLEALTTYVLEGR
ncbi:MAG TPA: TrkA C-terminal domain-containing protein [Microthrixaceae bacterium]|nr:TrkA C-terminal domain-containing protein [Microthrixaceae bacterium]